MSTQELIWQRMKSFRLRHKITQEEAAGLAEVPYKIWQKYESGRCKMMTIETAEKIAESMAITLAELVGEKEPDTAAIGVKASAIHAASSRFSYGLPAVAKKRKTDWTPTIYDSTIS
jgi:transcriptional regulator with XRE-family HTH domain